MKVLVWAGYGNTEVYALETPEQLRKVKSEIVQVLKSNFLFDFIKACMYLSKISDEDLIVHLESMPIQRLLSSCREAFEDVEDFETIEIVQVKR